MNSDFLVRLNADPMYLVSLRNGRPFGSPYPTQAIQMTFGSANEICRHLNEEGYEAVVVDRFGQLPTAADLESVKRSVEFQVVFSGLYFVGQNSANKDLGSHDRNKAVNMSQAAAISVCQRLKRMGHSDAVIVESSSSSLTVDVNQELSRIWPEEFSVKKQTAVDPQ